MVLGIAISIPVGSSLISPVKSSKVINNPQLNNCSKWLLQQPIRKGRCQNGALIIRMPPIGIKAMPIIKKHHNNKTMPTLG